MIRNNLNYNLFILITRRLSDEWQIVLEKKWKKIHAKFGYSSVEDPYALTVDKKLYFRTLTDLNRYSAFLIKVVKKCVMFLERKRLIILKKGIKKWAKSCGVMLESDIQSSHILEYAEEIVTDEVTPSDFQAQESTKVLESIEFFKGDFFLYLSFFYVHLFVYKSFFLV